LNLPFPTYNQRIWKFLCQGFLNISLTDNIKQTRSSRRARDGNNINTLELRWDKRFKEYMKYRKNTNREVDFNRMQYILNDYDKSFFDFLSFTRGPVFNFSLAGRQGAYVDVLLDKLGKLSEKQGGGGNDTEHRTPSSSEMVPTETPSQHEFAPRVVEMSQSPSGSFETVPMSPYRTQTTFVANRKRDRVNAETPATIARDHKLPHAAHTVEGIPRDEEDIVYEEEHAPKRSLFGNIGNTTRAMSRLSIPGDDDDHVMSFAMCKHLYRDAIMVYYEEWPNMDSLFDIWSAMYLTLDITPPPMAGGLAPIAPIALVANAHADTVLQMIVIVGVFVVGNAIVLQTTQERLSQKNISMRTSSFMILANSVIVVTLACIGLPDIMVLFAFTIYLMFVSLVLLGRWKK
jgi:hypothetical protein